MGNRRTAALLALALAAMLAAPGAASSAGAAPVPPTVTATPTTGLVDRQVITVSGAGLPTTPFGWVDFRVCSTDGTACYRNSSYHSNVDSTGRFSAPVMVPRRPFVTGQEPATVDCAVVACRLVVTIDNVVAPFYVPLSFDPSKPFTPQVVQGAPTTNLGYRAAVNVSGSGFDQRTVAHIVQCFHQGGSSYCGYVDHVRTDLSGNLAWSESVLRRVYVVSQQRTYDCVAAGATCEIIVDMGLRFSIPLTFDPAAPVPPIEVSMSDDNVTESTPETHTEVGLSEATDHPITIVYTVRHDTARPGIDYVKKVRHMTFLPGEVRHVIRIAIVDDHVPEPTERFRIDIDSISGAGAAVGRGRQYTTITDDD